MPSPFSNSFWAVDISSNNVSAILLRGDQFLKFEQPMRSRQQELLVELSR